MATTFSKASASQYSLKYQVTSAGSGATGTKTAAQLLADCVAGPLQAYLNNLNTSGAGAWQNLAGGLSSLVSVFVSSNGGGGIASADFSGAPNQFSATGVTAAGVAVVEIRFNHSAWR